MPFIYLNDERDFLQKWSFILFSNTQFKVSLVVRRKSSPGDNWTMIKPENTFETENLGYEQIWSWQGDFCNEADKLAVKSYFKVAWLPTLAF